MLENTPIGTAVSGMAIRPQSLTERLRDEQKRLQERYDEVTAVLDSLESNPETQSILDAVARLGHLNY
jgi:hypothetical protein